MDDITFCLSDCQRTDCYRHPSNIQDRTIPHSYADFKGTETCPEKMQLSEEDATKDATFDCISRQAAIDLIAYSSDDLNDNEQNWDMQEEFRKLPSVQPQRMSDDYKTDHGFMWLCPNCGLVVHSDFNKCVRCGKERPIEPQIIGNAVNLCETCKYDFPECPKDSNVIFGDGKGNDNVCACSAYEVYVPPISKREWYQKGYEAGQKSVQPQKGQAEPLELQDEQVGTHIIKTCPTCHTPWRIPPTSEYLKIAKYPCCPCGQRIRWGGVKNESETRANAGQGQAE